MTKQEFEFDCCHCPSGVKIPFKLIWPDGENMMTSAGLKVSLDRSDLKPFFEHHDWGAIYSPINGTHGHSYFFSNELSLGIYVSGDGWRYTIFENRHQMNRELDRVKKSGRRAGI